MDASDFMEEVPQVEYSVLGADNSTVMIENLLTVTTEMTKKYINHLHDALEEIDKGVSITNSSLGEAGIIQLKLYDILIPIFGSFIIILNLIVVISSGLILKRGVEPRSTYMFLGNVALADLLTGFAVLFGQLYPRHLRDELSCAIQLGMIVSSTMASVYSVGLIGVDRFLYILNGLQYQRYIYPNRARLLILFAWIISLIVGFLPVMGWRGDTDEGKICWFILMAPPALILLTTAIGLLPLLLIIVLYSIILHRALKRVVQLRKAAKAQNNNGAGGAVDGAGLTQGGLRLFRGGSSQILDDISRTGNLEDDAEQPQTKMGKFRSFLCCGKKETVKSVNLRKNKAQQLSKWKAIKVVLFTTGSFFITWVPYFVASVMYISCLNSNDSDSNYCSGIRIAIAGPLAILGFVNSLLNPIIYAWWHNGFRESFKKIYRNVFRSNANNVNARVGVNGATSVTNTSNSNLTSLRSTVSTSPRVTNETYVSGASNSSFTNDR